MTDVATPARTFPGLETMIKTLAVQASFAEQNGSSDDFVASIMENILSSESFDDIFAAQQMTGLSGQNFSGQPFIIRSAEDVVFLKSTKGGENGFPFYALLNIRPMSDPENELTLTCGGKSFMATLFALWTRGYFDADKYPEGRAMVITSHESPAGAYLNLNAVKAPTPSSKRAK
jgi:hypothetical protein